jgi:hypothetical protein
MLDRQDIGSVWYGQQGMNSKVSRKPGGGKCTKCKYEFSSCKHGEEILRPPTVGEGTSVQWRVVCSCHRQ